ncbi:MAG: DNA primase [Bryobacteraceae bacterium]
MDFVAQLKSSVDIVQVIGEYVRLKRSGTGGRYIGLCPFHNEKSPSFSVNGSLQFFKCFGCGMGGDVLKFVMEMDRLSFYEALKLLADRHGIPMPKRAEYSDEETRLRAAIYQMHEIAVEIFRSTLEGPAGGEVRGYLAKRGVSPEVAREFGLGYADRGGGLARAFEQRGFTAEQMEASGLVGRRESGGFYDRFRGRLMFPIHSEAGKTIGFGGRAIDPGDEPKYLNSPETPIYKKSAVLYNLHRAKEGIRKADRSVLVEGYMDVIGVAASGVREVVASCGTALTGEQVRSLKRHSGRIVVNFDPDAAGGNAAERSIGILLEEGIHVRILQLDGGLDPDEYCREHGAEVYRARLDQAGNYFHWLADRARSKFDMRDAEGRVAAFRFLLPAVQKLTDKLERLAVVNDVAGYLGLEAGLVLENFRKAAGQRDEKTLRAIVEPLRPVEKILLNLLLVHPEYREGILPPLRSLGETLEFATRNIFETIFTLYEANAPFGLAELDARLSEKDRNLLHSAVLADESSGESVSMEQGLACLAQLESARMEKRRTALKAKVREAERAGNMDEAMRLTEELCRLQSNEGTAGEARV